MGTKINQACVFRTIRQHAEDIVSGTMTTGDLKGLFEELRGYRVYLDEWVGEQSKEYQLTNAMLVLSRVLKTMGDDSSIRHWISKYPVYSEWYGRIEELLKESQDKTFNTGNGQLLTGVPFPV